ncbi:hypothetical protein JQK62_24070, partial [Leptospira santarosai]|nr:hypothetical protein [Leptospira santarosai]
MDNGLRENFPPGGKNFFPPGKIFWGAPFFPPKRGEKTPRERPSSPIEETVESGSKPEPTIRSRNMELGPGYMKWLNTLQIRDRRKILEVLDELSYG